MFIAVLTILISILLTAGGAVELIQGIANRLPYPLIGGGLGTLAGLLLLSAGVALLRQSPRTIALLRAAALVSVPVFVLIGLIRPLAGVPVTVLGIGFPLFLLVYYRSARLKDA